MNKYFINTKMSGFLARKTPLSLAASLEVKIWKLLRKIIEEKLTAFKL